MSACVILIKWLSRCCSNYFRWIVNARSRRGSTSLLSPTRFYHPRLGKLAEKAQTAIAELCLTVCQLFADTGCMHPSRDPRVEARRLHEVIDGSMLHLLVTPEVGEDAEAALADYLADLSAPATAGPER